MNTPETYVCNGPFMLAEMKKDESYTLVKNPNYYNADEVKIDTVKYVFLNAPETVKMAFDNGEIDHCDFRQQRRAQGVYRHG